MVKGKIVVKKPFNWKRLSFIILLVLGILVILGIVFFLGSLFSSPKQITVNITNPVTSLLENYVLQGLEINQEEVISQAEIEFDEEYINYALYALSAWKLRNMPFSNEEPLIQVIVSSDYYSSKVINSEIFTERGELKYPDIIIYSTKKEIIEAMLAEDMSAFMRESVSYSRTTIEMKASKLILAGKGYLQMYGEVTGENIKNLI